MKKTKRKDNAMRPDGGSAVLDRVKIRTRQATYLVLQYAWKRIREQVRSVAFIALYLVIIQTLVLGIPLRNAAGIALGVAAVIAGLALFLEGLSLGIMPLAGDCGRSLPRRSSTLGILLFALLLGVAATYAEPALQALQHAGENVKPWSAPLLYVLLNSKRVLLPAAVAAGVGIAVALSMIRLLHGWSLKPVLLIVVSITVLLSLYAYFEPNLRFVTGLAWDTGGVTTGPVTVPMVVALGLGISRIRGSEETGISGLGIVTLASLLPIIAVLSVGALLAPGLPAPLPREELFETSQKEKLIRLFGNEDGLKAYVLQEGSDEEVLRIFNNSEETLLEFLKRAAKDPQLLDRIGGNTVFQAVAERLALSDETEEIILPPAGDPRPWLQLLGSNGLAAVRAILPLSLFLLFVTLVVLRSRPRQKDEIVLGIFLSLVGMFLFGLGVEGGLLRLGRQTGNNMPSTFMTVTYQEDRRVIRPFDREAVIKAVTPDGQEVEYFYLHTPQGLQRIRFDAERYHPEGRSYVYVPEKGPLLGPGRRVSGLVLALLLAFMMGYGATLAEPALNSLGRKVEELSVGTFKQSLLVRTVAVGVGLGVAVGFAHIIWSFSLAMLLAPVYVLLLILSYVSTEEFVGIAWDSAGVTTGPITVPLVIALGLGISERMGMQQAFGIIATASAFPILTVLSAGLYVSRQRRLRLSGR